MKSPDPESLKKVLLQVIKWLKILLAVLMFIVGLLSESMQINPNADPMEVEVCDDSLAISLVGIGVNLCFGAPTFMALGALVRLAVS